VKIALGVFFALMILNDYKNSQWQLKVVGTIDT
jgi:hypothetical protein